MTTWERSLSALLIPKSNPPWAGAVILYDLHGVIKSMNPFS